MLNSTLHEFESKFYTSGVDVESERAENGLARLGIVGLEVH